MKNKIYLRADANQLIGHGHLFRMLALAEVIKDQFAEIIFILNDSTPEAFQRITDSGFSFLECGNEQFFKLLDPSAIVVLDGYAFSLAYQKAIKVTKALLVVFDDHRFNETFCADYIINVAGGIPFERYTKPFYCQVLFGPKYAIIQSAFLNIPRKEHIDKSLFVSLGGSDINNFTEAILLRLFDTWDDDFEINVVLGGSYKYIDKLKSLIADSGKKKISIHQNLETKDMATLMSKSTHAVTSASTVAYEFGFTKGNLYIVITADNQEYLYNYLINNKLAFPLESLFTNEEDNQMIENQAQVFTSKFVDRYHNLFNKLTTESQISLRNATIDDAKLLFEWANDQEVRDQSFNSNKIKWDDHQLWLTNKLENDKSFIFICLLHNRPVGQVRFDKSNIHYIIDYSVSDKNRGKGIGFLMLKKALIYMKNQKRRCNYRAEVKELNTSSLKCFEKLGFQTKSVDKGIVQFELTP